jgi:hypothetical protein
LFVVSKFLGCAYVEVVSERALSSSPCFIRVFVFNRGAGRKIELVRQATRRGGFAHFEAFRHPNLFHLSYIITRDIYF